MSVPKRRIVRRIVFRRVGGAWRTARRAAPRAVRAPPSEDRRLTDRVLAAFHLACDDRDLEMARQLLALADLAMQRALPPPGGERRRCLRDFVLAHERFWLLRRHGAGLAPPSPGARA